MVAADYMHIRGSRSSVHGSLKSALQLLDAQMKETTTWDVHDVCYADSGMNGKRFVLGGRSCMRMLASSMSVDASLNYKRLLIAVFQMNSIP